MKGAGVAFDLALVAQIGGESAFEFGNRRTERILGFTIGGMHHQIRTALLKEQADQKEQCGTARLGAVEVQSQLDRLRMMRGDPARQRLRQLDQSGTRPET